MNSISSLSLWRLTCALMMFLTCRLSAEGIPYPSFKVEYPTLSGRLALTGIRVNTDYNYIRIVDVSQSVSKDIAYIQCKDPVYFNQPVLIGKNDSIWQYRKKPDSLEIVIHKNGDSFTEKIQFPGSVSIDKTEIIADDEVNYLVVFLKKENKLDSIKFIFVDGSMIRVSDWSLFSDCEICKHGSWSMSTSWIKLASHKLGPVVSWCDFKEPPKFHSLVVKVSQSIDGDWTSPVVLDREGADTKHGIYADGINVLVVWINSSLDLNAARIHSKNGIQETWIVTNLTEERCENTFPKEFQPIILDGIPYLFFVYDCFSSEKLHLDARRFDTDSWTSLGTINQTENALPFYPYTSDGDVSVIFQSDEEIYEKTLKADKWIQTDQMKPSQCYLKTLGRCVTISDFNLDVNLHIPAL